MPLLQGLEIQRLGRGGLRRRGAPHEGTHEVGIDVAVRQGNGALDEVLQLADVAGEVVVQQQGQRLGA